MERNEQVMKNLNLSGCGLEIGPSYNPVLPKKNGYDVKVLDYTTREGLVDHYRDDPNVKIFSTTLKKWTMSGTESGTLN